MKNLRKLLLCLIALITTGWLFGDEATDIASIKQDVQMLRTLINSQTMWYYNWNTGEQKTSGTQQSIAFSLRHIGIGLHDSILPAIERVAANTSILTNLITLAESIDTTLGSVSSDVDSIKMSFITLEYYIDQLTTLVGDIRQNVANLAQYAYLIYEELSSFRSDFVDYKNRSLDYLQSIDNNVSSIAENVQKGEGYLSDIYNSISAGINVNVANGFPESYDYTSLLELMAYNGIWSQFEDYRQNRVGRLYLSGGVTWSHLGDMTTNTTVKTGITLSGDFFSDVVDLLAGSDEKLAGIQKSLMLIYENIAKAEQVDPEEIARQEIESTDTDIPESDNPLGSVLEYPSINPYTEGANISGIDGSSLPDTITFYLPSTVFSAGGDIIINTSDYATAFTTARWVVRFSLWGLVLFLGLKLFGLFSKCVLSPVLAVAKKWVGGAVNV